MDARAPARAFVEHYYNTFDTNWQALIGLYQEESMLTFEEHKFRGAQDISNKLNGLEECEHNVRIVDCMPPEPSGETLVVVYGQLMLGPGQGMLLKSNFVQSLYLVPTPQGSFYVSNDIFRTYITNFRMH